MELPKLERLFELSTIGAVIFIGMVAMIYSWIDTIFVTKADPILLTAAALAVSILSVYAMYHFDIG